MSRGDFVRQFKSIDSELLATLALPAVLLVASVVLFLVGRDIFGINSQADVEALIESFRTSLWAPFVVLAVFTLVGLTGFPQFMLMAAVVVIFGPMLGFVYAWLATVFSAYAGFIIGHYMGHKILQKYGGERMNRLSQMLGDNGIFASIMVRVVPTAPFAVVNLVSGASHISWIQFAIGTLIGVVPKAALIAYIGKGLGDVFTSGDPLDLLVIAVVIGVWIFAGVWLQKMMKKSRNGPNAASSNPATASSALGVEDRVSGPPAE